MFGPPYIPSRADVGWMRMFFNTTPDALDNNSFISTCGTVDDICSINDWTLRGSTPYPNASTLVWEQAIPPKKDLLLAIGFSASSGGIAVLLIILNVINKLVNWATKTGTFRNPFRSKVRSIVVYFLISKLTSV
jgi:hypothetical protein